MALLGGIVSAHAPVKFVEKIAYGSAFLILAVVGMRLLIQQSDDTAKAAAEYKRTLATIASSTTETTRMQHLNTQLQERLLAQSSVITDLGRRGINTATGGDSFCYMVFTSSIPGELLPVFLHRGRYPLYDVTARIIDHRLLSTRPPLTGRESVRNLMAGSEVVLRVGNMTTGSAWFGPSLAPPFDEDDEKFSINFDARNGFWHEELRYHGPKGHRSSAIRVWRGLSTGKESVVFEMVDREFPRTESGDVKWE
jgi:hypothetical protein